jgi:hypothetical protein
MTAMWVGCDVGIDGQGGIDGEGVVTVLVGLLRNP